MPAFHTQRRVEFSDTDAAGIIHFASLIIYMEQAEHALFRQAGLSVMMADPDGAATIGWPRVHVECDFHGRAKFEDVLDIQVTILKLGNKSATYGFDITCADASGNHHLVCRGRTTSVCCRIEGETMESIPIPPFLREKLATYCL